MINKDKAKEIIRYGIREDIHHCDITTDYLVEEEHRSSAKIVAKEEGIVAGTALLTWVFEEFDPDITVILLVKDGQRLSKGEVIAEISGKTKALLKGERLALNFLQRMSGIATLSRNYAEMAEGYEVRITDTRKTSPGLRMLEKYAVKVGGCHNHRYNLSDGVMIKDNHIIAAGSITNAVNRLKDQIPHTAKIEVEVTTIEQLKEAIESGAEVVMLDNMSIAQMKQAVLVAAGKVITEASGGVTFETLQEIIETGVDVISVGALTHSAKALDISMSVFSKP